MHSGGGEKGAFGFGFWGWGGRGGGGGWRDFADYTVGGEALSPFSSCFAAVSNLPPPFAAIVVGLHGEERSA